MGHNIFLALSGDKNSKPMNESIIGSKMIVILIKALWYVFLDIPEIPLQRIARSILAMRLTERVNT